MSETFLSPVSHSNFTQSPDLTPIQVKMDGLVSTFVDRVMDGYPLAGFVVGGAARQVIRSGIFTLGRSLPMASKLFVPLTHLAALGSGFAAESIIVDAFPKIGRVALRGENISLLNLYGNEGLIDGATHSAISLFSFKLAGVISAPLNSISQNIFQSTTMVAAHHISAQWGLLHPSRENEGFQWIEAEMTLLQLWVGMRILHPLFPKRMEGAQYPSRSNEVLQMAAQVATLPSSSVGNRVLFGKGQRGVNIMMASMNRPENNGHSSSTENKSGERRTTTDPECQARAKTLPSIVEDDIVGTNKIDTNPGFKTADMPVLESSKETPTPTQPLPALSKVEQSSGVEPSSTPPPPKISKPVAIMEPLPGKVEPKQVDVRPQGTKAHWQFNPEKILEELLTNRQNPQYDHLLLNYVRNNPAFRTALEKMASENPQAASLLREISTH
jgi:hypothetical protein